MAESSPFASHLLACISRRQRDHALDLLLGGEATLVVSDGDLLALAGGLVHSRRR